MKIHNDGINVEEDVTPQEILDLWEHGHDMLGLDVDLPERGVTPYAHLSAMLNGPSEPKVHCDAPRRTNLTQQPNYIVARCTLPKGHLREKHASVHVPGEWS